MRDLWLLVFLLFTAAIDFPRASANTPQTIYCIGNHDATGACWKEGGEDEQELGCLITSWPIVECQSIPKNKEKAEVYECLALQNTGIVNQIALSCQSTMSKGSNEETDSVEQTILNSTPKPESANIPDAASQATVLEREEIIPSAFQPGVENTTFGVEQPQDFKDAF